MVTEKQTWIILEKIDEHASDVKWIISCLSIVIMFFFGHSCSTYDKHSKQLTLINEKLDKLTIQTRENEKQGRSDEP